MTRSSTALGAVSQYTVSFVNATPIPLRSVFIIKIPLDQVTITSTPIECLTSFTLQTLTCQTTAQTDTYMIVKVQEWCSGGVGACPSGTDNTFVLR